MGKNVVMSFEGQILQEMCKYAYDFRFLKKKNPKKLDPRGIFMYIIIIFKSLLLPNPLADQSQIFKETSVYEGGTNVFS